MFAFLPKIFTPKVLANASPGFALKPWDNERRDSHNPERVRHVASNHNGNEPFQGSITIAYVIPGLPKLNPGLELANTFGVIQSCFFLFVFLIWLRPNAALRNLWLTMEPVNSFNEPLILASGSPRRAEILDAVGWPFEAITAGIDETLLPGELPHDYVQRLAREKAEAVAKTLESGLILGADTTVVVDEHLLGQPTDDNDARRMLRLLSGKWHDVLTGVALVRIGGESKVDYERTRVRFAEMSDAEIDWYVASGEPKGKAGAYGIQGKAALFIEQIDGDYLNIVGLPIRLVYQMSDML